MMTNTVLAILCTAELVTVPRQDPGDGSGDTKRALVTYWEYRAPLVHGTNKIELFYRVPVATNWQVLKWETITNRFDRPPRNTNNMPPMPPMPK